MERRLCLCALASFALACGSPAPDASQGPDAPPATGAGPTPSSSQHSSAAGGTLIDLPKVSGGPRENAILRLGITEAGFFDAGRPVPPGRRYYAVGLRGISRSDSGAMLGGSKGDDVIVDVRRFVFAQDERGCLARPEFTIDGVANLFGDTVTFSPAKEVEGRLVFLMPDDAKRVRVLLAPAGSDGLAVPAGDDFTPAWPAPQHTIDDGTTLRILVLPRPAPPSSLPAPAAGREHVMLDVVVQNVSATQGVEFQPSQQLRLVDSGGKFVQASQLTAQLGCRIADSDVIPPGHAARLLAVFDMPAGAPAQLQYRGFEKEEARVDIR